MHKEVLTDDQIKLLPLVEKFSRNFGLVGGTAIALQIGHRQSIDFDLFTYKPFNNLAIRKKIQTSNKIEKIIRDEEGQYTMIINGVLFTFFHYPFKINFSKRFEDIIRIPDLLTLSAMKAYALGRRAKWKDYVDLYFVMKKYHGIDKVIERTKEIFGEEFNEKMFKAQLAYFNDVNYSEEVVFAEGFEVSDDEVKKGLVEFSLA